MFENIQHEKCTNQGNPTVRFWGISVAKAQNHLRYSDLVAVKARDFFGETSPRNEESLVPIVFIGTNMVRVQNKVS